MLVTTGFTGNSRASVPDKTAHHFTIDIDGRMIATNSMDTDPQQVLAQAGVILWQGDSYDVSEIDDHNTHIKVMRAVPVVISFGGQATTVMTNRDTVEEVLLDQGYNMADIESPTGMSTAITRNMTIVVQDSEAVRQAKIEQQKQEERKRVRLAGGPANYRTVYTMEASAYLPSDGGGAGITAMGIPARYGVVAVDPSVIPLGTRLYIPGYGEAIAADTGGAINGHKIDLCMEDYGSAIQFGRRTVQVYVLD